MFARSPEAILKAGRSRSARKSALASSNAVANIATPSSRQCSRSSNQASAGSSSASRCSPYVAPKLFSLSYGWSKSARVKRRRLSRFWNLTAFTPASAAASTSCFARSSSPWWLWPISAMT